MTCASPRCQSTRSRPNADAGGNASRSSCTCAPGALELADDLLGLLTRERAERLGLLAALRLQPRDDLERDLVVRRLEHLDDVVAAERHPDADELAARLLDGALAVLDAIAPRRQSHP